MNLENGYMIPVELAQQDRSNKRSVTVHAYWPTSPKLLCNISFLCGDCVEIKMSCLMNSMLRGAQARAPARCAGAAVTEGFTYPSRLPRRHPSCRASTVAAVRRSAP